ncbi:MAG: MCE family protein, partial [Actinophytocola sp.]|nr:MCE family protein [Actinophytocola sp.]
MASRRGRRNKTMIIGLVVLVALVGSVVVALTSHGRLPGAANTAIKAAFTEVGSLNVGDDVRIGGVRVGRVSEIVLRDGAPVATLDFDGERTIYRNSRAEAASVGARSALGQKYVDFIPGRPAAGVLKPGEIIPASNTQGAQELSDVLAVLDEPTRRALGSTIRETGGGAGGHVDDFRDALRAMPNMLPDVGKVSRALSADGGQDVTTLLRVTDSLSRRFADRQHQISDTLAQLDTTLGAVAVNEGRALSE